jgi:hypothetical protein
MAKWGSDVPDTFFFCDRKTCGNCKQEYDYCQCNQDNATDKYCEDCIDNGLAPDCRGIQKKSISKRRRG